MLIRAFFAAVALASIIPVHAASAPDTAAVEKIRGLTFSGPVKSNTISPAELKTYLNTRLDSDLGMSFEEYERVLDALHLHEASPLTREKILALYASQVLAFYDPETDRFSTIDPAPGGELMATMAPFVEIHELMHALQDQRFDAGRKLESLERDWDAQLAYHSLLEGEATLVMLAAIAGAAGGTLDAMISEPAMLQMLSGAVDATGAIDGPRYFTESMKFPYVDGLKFVIAAYKRGGWKAVDELHARPPRSTEEVLHPELYPSVQKASSKAKTSGSPALLETTLGEFHWKYLLSDKAAAGWAGDRVRVIRAGDALRVEAETQWDGEADAKEFAAAYSTFLEARDLKAKVDVSGTAVKASYVARKAPAAETK